MHAPPFVAPTTLSACKTESDNARSKSAFVIAPGLVQDPIRMVDPEIEIRVKGGRTALTIPSSRALALPRRGPTKHIELHCRSIPSLNRRSEAAVALGSGTSKKEALAAPDVSERSHSQWDLCAPLQRCDRMSYCSLLDQQSINNRDAAAIPIVSLSKETQGLAVVL